MRDSAHLDLTAVDRPTVQNSPRYSVGTLHYTTFGLFAAILWLLVGELGIAMRERSALPSGLEFLRLNAASDTTTSLLISTVPAVLSLLLLPLIGYHSDRLRTRWGRRRPFLMVIAPVGAAAVIGLALSSEMGRWTHEQLASLSPGVRICNLAYFCVFWTIFECTAITTFALFTGLVNDVMPHRFLGRFYAGFRIVGLSVGIAFNSFVFALTENYLREILLTVGLVFGGSVLLMCVMVKEGSYPDEAGSDSNAKRVSFAMPRAHILECFSHPFFLWAVAAFMLASMTFSPFHTFYQFYASTLGISKATLGTLTAYSYGVSIFLAFGIGWLVDRYGAILISAIMMSLYFMVAATGYLWMDGEQNFRIFYVAHVVVSGAYYTAAASMPMALFPSAQFVRYNSSKDVMVTLAVILGSSIQGPALDLSGHNYQLTLLSAALFSLLCVMCLVRLHARKPVC
ncbi:MFS transporter [Undibacterium sp. Di26W]|uniref:MFS transporter n=1 Tax=Undibacterium sp. Di26W TaxID=3413035 RepID=UPI003BF1D7BD